MHTRIVITNSPDLRSKTRRGGGGLLSFHLIFHVAHATSLLTLQKKMDLFRRSSSLFQVEDWESVAEFEAESSAGVSLSQTPTPWFHPLSPLAFDAFALTVLSIYLS